MHVNTVSFKLIFYSIIILAKGDSSNNLPVVEYYNINDNQYVFFSQKLTWDEASLVCAAHNGRLAVLDTVEKATDVAHAMADSNIAMRDAWIAGRRFEITWLWTDSTNFTTSGSVIPPEPDIENFPPWTREPTRNKKECLALDRLAHSNPSFIDLDCRLPKPFICQKRLQDSLNTPVPSKRIPIDKSVYILYHGQLTWADAVTFCRQQGSRLAVIKNQKTLNILTSNMIKCRPDFESVWIGAHYSFGKWTWLSTGSALSLKSDNSGYPPWRSGKPEKNSGCLLLDRHLDRYADFIEIPCDRNRDFVCEEYPPEEAEEWENQPVKFTYQNETFAIYPTEKTWDESRLYCEETGGTLGYVDSLKLASTLVLEMGDHPKDISHLWLGGIYLANESEWRWIHNNEVFPPKSNASYQPWADTLMETDVSSEETLCLNLDKTDQSKPNIYGLDCKSKQPFLCIMDCKNPPLVINGEWKCDESSNTQTCSLNCDDNYYSMGLDRAKCSSDIGWFNYNKELNPPLCLNISDYVQRVVRSLSQDILKSSGYYIVLSNEKMQSLSFKFIEKLLNIFPLSKYLKMGMSTYFTNPPSNIPYEQNDTCTALKLVNIIETGNHQGETEKKIFSDWPKEIMKNKKGKSVIIAILDSDTATESLEAFEQLKLQGHFVVAIGLKEDWEKLLPLATIGYEQRINLYLFDEEEYELFVDEFNQLKNKAQKKCTESQSAKTSDIPEPDLKIAARKESADNEDKSAENDDDQTIAKESTERLESPDTIPENKSEEKSDVPESKTKTSAEDNKQGEVQEESSAEAPENKAETHDEDPSDAPGAPGTPVSDDSVKPPLTEGASPAQQENKKRNDMYAQYHIAETEEEREDDDSSSSDTSGTSANFNIDDANEAIDVSS